LVCDFCSLHSDCPLLPLMAHATLTRLNGLMPFLLSAGLRLIFSMMCVSNFAHASFHMRCAQLGLATAGWARSHAQLLALSLVRGVVGRPKLGDEGLARFNVQQLVALLAADVVLAEILHVAAAERGDPSQRRQGDGEPWVGAPGLRGQRGLVLRRSGHG
jgi:branched-subunit amino acid ABC-type transport system permease component